MSEAHGMGDQWTERHIRRWDLYFAMVWVITTLFILLVSSPGLRARLITAGLFALTVPWYVWVGRPVLLVEGADVRRAVLYTAGMVGLFLPLTVVVGETQMATFAIAPQCFMLLRRAWAVAAMLVINGLPVALWGLVARPLAAEWVPQALFSVVAIAFSVVLGTWVTHIAEQSAERARLIEELATSRDEIARLSTAHGAMTERDRLSREIHDTLAQGFTSLLMLVQALEADLERDPVRARDHLALMAATARENLAEARALVAGGGPAGLDGSSLPDALRRVAARHSAESGAPASVEVGGAPRALPAAAEVVALRACQEALANVRQHAGPGAPVTITLEYGADAVRLRVHDRGRGFEAAPEVADGGRGYGLAGIRARATEIGGTARISAVPGGGTEVSVLLPVLPGPEAGPARSEAEWERAWERAREGAER
ncbi:sensor histidine kinase [Streptomyces sp. B6B3]|uniref:sensor histidine kinase n=1 Tax=Streptomyces sp. B6B3 TaxID=3153570 RepID=UPI00325CC76B